MTGTIVLSGVAWATINCDKDDSVTNAKNALAVAIVCGVIHSLCVFWIQIAVLKSITKELDKEQSYIPETERNYDITDNYRTRVRRAIWEVIKYDFVFLLYVFFCPAVFGLGCCGMFIVPQCTGKDAWAAAWAFGGLIFYNGFSGLYFLWLMCGICCGAGTETVKTQVKKTKRELRRPNQLQQVRESELCCWTQALASAWVLTVAVAAHAEGQNAGHMIKGAAIVRLMHPPPILSEN